MYAGRPPINSMSKKKRPVDRHLPKNLIDFENKIDSTITRKKLDLQEALSKPIKSKRTLRVFISNTASDQYTHMQDDTVISEGTPSFSLKIEGRLLEMPNSRKPTASLPKFSTFIKSIHVELLRDSNLYPQGNIIEWYKQPGMADCDGVEIKRFGDVDIPAKILIHLEYTPEKFKLTLDLAKLLDIHTDTKANIIMALWQYVKLNKLQDIEDRRIINCDETLLKLFNAPKIMFPHVPDLLNNHLLPPDPVVIDYVICVDKEFNAGKYAYDIEVEMNDVQRNKLNNFIGGNPQLNKEISMLDEKAILYDIQLIQISSLIQTIHQSKVKRDFLKAFSHDPVNFLKQFIISQNQDVQVMVGDIKVNREEARKSEFYDGEWVEEAVKYYLTSRN